MSTVKEKRYFARVGAPFAQGMAQEIGEHLENNNLNTPKKMLEDARKEDSVLHNLVNWDDKSAAEEHRLQQLKNVVNHLSVEIIYEGGETETFDRGFEYVVTEGERSYIEIDKGLSNVEYNKQILSRAWMTLSGWMARYKSYKEFNKIVKAYKETAKDYDFESIAV